MKTVSRVYDTLAQARNAITAIEAAGVPSSGVNLVANKYVSEKYADVKEVSPTTGYSESVRRDDTLVCARVDDQDVPRIQAILDNHCMHREYDIAA